MKLKKEKIAENSKYIIISFIISAILFLLLPVSYYVFHSQIYNIMKAKQIKTVRVETVRIKKKEREVKEIEKTKKRLKKIQRRFFDRFNLDLSVLSAKGDGSGMFEADFGNIIEEGEADVPPIKRIFTPPKYPERAKNEGIEAVVVVKLLIDEKGNVLKVRIMRTPRYWGFDDSVIEAAKKWKFEPAKLNNMPVKIWATQAIEFRL